MLGRLVVASLDLVWAVNSSNNELAAEHGKRYIDGHTCTYVCISRRREAGSYA